MNNKTRFSSRVENYVKYRPNYPKDALSFLFENGINKDNVVADIGSGTGIFSNQLITNVKKLYCVEPNDPMREYAESLLNKYDNFYSIKAPAEATTLEDNSIDAIVVAQAFHWFDIEKCQIEFNRILKDENSHIFLIWNNRLSNTDFLLKYDEVLCNLSKDYNIVNHQNLGDREFDYFFDKKWAKYEFDNVQIFNKEQFVGRVASSSYNPEKGDDIYEKFYENINRIFDEENEEGFVKFNYKTQIITNV